MRITFLAPCNDLSGGLLVIATYANKLIELGHSVTIVYPKKQLRLHRKIKQAAVKLFTHQRTHFDHFKGLLLAVSSFDNRSIPDADILIATAWETAEWSRSLSRSKGRKYYFIQGHEVWNGNADQVYQTYNLPFRKITVSSWLKDLVSQLSGDENIDVVPNACDFPPVDLEAIHDKRRYDVGMVYSVSPHKGANAGITMLNILHGKNPELNFVLFGTERPAEELPPNTRFYLKPSRSKIASIYQSAKLWISTSLEEGFCLPCLEAMSAGSVVVSTDNKGVNDIIENGKSGYIIPSNKPDDMVNQIEDLLLKTETLQQTRIAGVNRSKHFNWNRSAEKLSNILMEV